MLLMHFETNKIGEDISINLIEGVSGDKIDCL